MIIAAAEAIVKRYGTQLVLDNVDLEIRRGDILGLLGPNGAGKTTLIHALAGLLAIDSGEVRLFGEQAVGDMHDAKRRMGLVTQEISVFQDLTARENLEFFGGIYGLRGTQLQEQVHATLEIVGLSEHAKKLPAKFSGGMSRRLNIACALVHKPEFLIMDEPTVGIDPQSRHHILETVRKLNAQGTTILYTTHYMEEAQALASRVVIMDQGHVMAEGTIAELVKTIQHEEKIRIEMVEPNQQLLAELKQLRGVKQAILEGRQIQIISQVGSGNLDRVLEIARRAGAVLAVNAEQPTLEDVFLTLTGKQLRDEEDR